MTEPDLPPELLRQGSAIIQEALTLKSEFEHLRERARRSSSCLVLIDLLLTIVDQIVRCLFQVLSRHLSAWGLLQSLRGILKEQVAPYADIISRALDGRLPWGQVYPLESLCRKISPESRLLIYADARAGYTYREALGDLRNWRQTVSDLSSAAGEPPAEFPRFLAVFSVPDVECNVVLQNAAWSHEIGHHIDAVFGVSDRILQNPLFDPRRPASVGGGDGSEACAAPPGVTGPAEEGQTRDARSAALTASFQVLSDWVRELVADLFAVHVFGPASVFAIAEIASSLSVAEPGSRSHPPMWLRVAVMLDELDNLGYDVVFHAEGLDKEAEEVREAVAGRVKELRSLPLVALAHRSDAEFDPVLESVLSAQVTIAEQVRQTIRSTWRCEASEIARDVYALVARLDQGLPPCEVDIAGHTVGRETSIAAIVNAGWFRRIWRRLDAAPADLAQAQEQHTKLRNLDLLVLKAIELSAIKHQLGKAEVDEPAPEVHLGGVLTRRDIRAYLARPWPQKLVVTPLTDVRRQLGSNGIDLKLGYELLVPRSGHATYLSIQQPTETIEAVLEAAHERVHLPIGETFVLHEQQFVMATTLEYVRLPSTLAGYVMGRSSWERVGLHVRPARIPPGYTGCIQLQLVSHKDVPIELVTGARICQLLLFPVSTPLEPLLAPSENRRDEVVVHPTFSPILYDDELADLQKERPHLILGIASTLGAWESDLAEYLTAEHGFCQLSLATPVYEEARRRGLPITISNLQDVGNSLREAYGPEVLVERLRPAIQRLPQDANVVVMAIKNPGEVKALRSLPNFRLVTVDAPPALRFKRARADALYDLGDSYEAFDRLDRRDRGEHEPSWGQQVRACMEMDDYTIDIDPESGMREQFERCFSWIREEMA